MPARGEGEASHAGGGSGGEQQALEDILASMARGIKRLVDSQTQRNVSEASSASTSTSMQHATSLLGNFTYKPDQDLTFPVWFARNRALLEASTAADKLRV